jgi:hypothetical protein
MLPDKSVKSCNKNVKCGKTAAYRFHGDVKRAIKDGLSLLICFQPLEAYSDKFSTKATIFILILDQKRT